MTDSRSWRLPSPPVGLRAGGGGAVVTGVLLWLGFHDGGYFPVTWNSTTIVLLCFMSVAFLTRAEISFGPLDAALVLGLAGLTGWTLLSATWSIAPASSIFEAERMLLYLAGGITVLVVGSRAGPRWIAMAILAAVAVICGWALIERLGAVDPLPYNRLGGPVGYWNALGALAAAGACCAVALVAHERTWAARALAAASLPILVAALYLTFSRGSFLMLGIGLTASVVVDPRRRELASAVAALVMPSLLVLVAAAAAHALTTPRAAPIATSTDAHRLGIVVLTMCVASGYLGKLAPRLGSRLPRVSSVRFGAAVVTIAIVVGVTVAGGPSRLPGATRAFDSAPPSSANDLSGHLVNLSGSWRGEMWGVAWTTFAHHPVIGNGAGTYGRLWLMKRRDPITVEDAHSLYLETLSELGIVGLVLLTTVIVAPILAFRRLRSAPYVPAVVSVYIGLLVHAAIDWDWEMPVVTVAMLTCGATMVAAARRELTPLRRGVRIGAVAGASILVAGAAVLLVGNRDLDAAAAAAAGGSETLAVRAEAARQWVPWSPDPLRWLGSVQLERGNQGRARQLLGAALRRDRTDWSLWLELAVASKGAERHQAIIEAARLDPVGPDVLVTGGRYGLVTHARARSPGTG